MMPITTSSSTSVNPTRRADLMLYLAVWEDPAQPRGELLGERNRNNRCNG